MWCGEEERYCLLCRALLKITLLLNHHESTLGLWCYYNKPWPILGLVVNQHYKGLKLPLEVKT